MAPEFQHTAPFGGVGVRPPKKLVGPTPMGDNPLMDWGVWPPNNDDTKKGDYQVASWAVKEILNAPKDQPFFIAAGFFLPHVPCYATQQWFDLFPDDDSVLPEILETDRDDTPRFSWYLHWRLPEPRLKWAREKGQWRNLVRSYLACTSFVDAQVGRLMDALDEAVSAGTRNFGKQELFERLAAQRLPCAPVRGVSPLAKNMPSCEDSEKYVASSMATSTGWPRPVWARWNSAVTMAP